MLQLSGEKMSKSLGNLVTIEEFLGKHEGDVLRLLVLNSNYRNPLTYNEEVVLQTSKALERLRTALNPPLSGTAAPVPAAEEALCILEEQMQATKQGFIESMDDDFNTAGALGHLFELVRAINQARDAGVNAEQLGRAQSLLKELAGMLGLQLDRSSPHGKMEIAPFVDLLLEVRKELRRQKLWQLSDSIRVHLSELGVVLEDHKDGTTWHS
jgi:cysteinyl-tRNA synthetase